MKIEIENFNFEDFLWLNGAGVAANDGATDQVPPPHSDWQRRLLPKTRGAAPLHSPIEVLAYHDYWVRVMQALPDGRYHGPKIPGNFVG